MREVEIRPLVTIAELQDVEALQREVWGMPDIEIVPGHQLLAAANAGGAVLGAFVGGRLVGFCYGFVGLRNHELLFYSHMAGVLEPYRGTAVGILLKRAQREVALARGAARMVWTFDPLMSRNARFNLHKLGAVASRYHLNYYGEMRDALNRGLPSDRLEVDWHLRDPQVEARLRGEPPPAPPPAAAVLTAVPAGEHLRPAEPVLDSTAAALRVEIPAAFAAIKRADPALARSWLEAVRRTLPHYFRRGYAAVDFVLDEPPTRGAYILRAGPAA